MITDARKSVKMVQKSLKKAPQTPESGGARWFAFARSSFGAIGFDAMRSQEFSLKYKASNGFALTLLKGMSRPIQERESFAFVSIRRCGFSATMA